MLWQVPGKQGVSMPWFDEQGRPNFVRHPEHDRNNEIVIEDYAAGIAQQGIVTASRGKAFGLLSPSSTGFPVLLITFGSLSKALYIATQRYAPDQWVQASLLPLSCSRRIPLL